MYPRLLFIAFLFFGTLLLADSAFAAPKAFGKADAAWHRGELEEAQALYQGALDEGGLEAEEVVIAYSRIGTVKAALKDTAGALSDFRVAAAIDPNFELPADSGPVARKLYSQAKGEAGAQGERLSLNLKAPKEIPANEAFTIATEIPEGFSVFVTQVVVVVEDTLTGKKWRKKLPSSGKLSFKFPPKVAESGARLKVRVSGVDGKDNAWVSESLKIKVKGSRAGAPAAGGSWGKSEDPFAKDKGKDPKKDDGGIFAGPVPWIVGGVVVVAAAVAIFFVAQPSDDVSVGAPAWQ